MCYMGHSLGPTAAAGFTCLNETVVRDFVQGAGFGGEDSIGVGIGGKGKGSGKGNGWNVTARRHGVDVALKEGGKVGNVAMSRLEGRNRCRRRREKTRGDDK